MSVRMARALMTGFFVLFAAAVMWPGYVPFNRIRPLVFGLPFSMVWVALWVLAAALVLWGLDRVEARERGPASDGDPEEEG